MYAAVTHKKDIFLSNDSNKKNFILMLAEKFSSCGFFVHHAHADADLLIVRSALECAQSRSTVVFGDDTDLLILLCYHNDLQSPFSVYLKLRIWNIKRTQEKLGIGICRNILVLHAILGCDTTSRIFTSGKGMALKKMVSDNNFTRAIEVLNKLPKVVTKQDIIKAGEEAIIAMYNGKGTLDSLRYQTFCKKVLVSNKVLEAKTLPPTSAAAKYHTMRV